MALWYVRHTLNRDGTTLWLKNHKNAIFACFYAYLEAYPVYKHHKDQGDDPIESMEARDNFLWYIETELWDLYDANMDNKRATYLDFKDKTETAFENINGEPNVSWSDFKHNAFSNANFYECAKFAKNVVETFDASKFILTPISELGAKKALSFAMSKFNKNRDRPDAPNDLGAAMNILSAIH